MKGLLCLMTVLGVLFQASWVAAMPVSLVIRKLHCEKTTEMGQDEVYLVVAGRYRGAAFQYRLPADAPHKENGHWNLNDGKPPRSVDNIMVWSGDLQDGEAVNVAVTGMEEDGGVPGTWLQISGAMLQAVPDPSGVAPTVGKIAAAAGAILKAVKHKDDDDYLGSFNVLLQNKSGKVHATWGLGDRMKDTKHRHVMHFENIKTREFWFTGDGSRYFIYIRTDPAFR